MINPKTCAIGIELGSTRIKAVLIDENHIPVASGDFEWENQLVDGIWTYPLDLVHTGVQTCFANLKQDVEAKFGVKLTTVGETLNQEDGKEHYTEYEERKTTNPVYGSSGAADDNEAFGNHRHDYKGDKWWKVNLKLQAGESVLLLRTDGGQKYIVLDRIFAPNNKGEIR